MISFTVYVLVDPRSDKPFYVGCTRATKHRKLAHRYGQKSSPAYSTIRDIRASGLEVEFRIMGEGMEKLEALWMERELALTLPDLTNKKGRGLLCNYRFPRRIGSWQEAKRQFIEYHKSEPDFAAQYLQTW